MQCKVGAAMDRLLVKRGASAHIRRVRRLLARLHRWFGLASGLVVFIVGLAGAVYVWEAELFAASHRRLVYVEPSGTLASADAVLAAARSALPPERPVIRLTWHADPRRSVVAMAQRLVDEAPTYFHEFLYYDEVFINPYTAQVLGVVDRKHEWIYITRMIHTNLLLATRGTWIVATSTIVFALMVIVGMVLWWPRTRAVWRTRFMPRLAGPWKRSVFDGHNILGAYGALGMLFLALTGPVWTWKWYEGAVAWLFTGEARVTSPPVPKPPPSTGDAVAEPLQLALSTVRTRIPDGRRYMVDMPGGKFGALTVGVIYDHGSAWEEYDRYFFDARAATPVGDERFDEKNLGLRWRNSNYGLHTATLYGWPMQVAGSLLCLLVASLPVTGVLIWFPRWRRRRAN